MNQVIFLTAISHHGLRNAFFSIPANLLVSYFHLDLCFPSLFGFYFPFLFGLLDPFSKTGRVAEYKGFSRPVVTEPCRCRNLLFIIIQRIYFPFLLDFYFPFLLRFLILHFFQFFFLIDLFQEI